MISAGVTTRPSQLGGRARGLGQALDAAQPTSRGTGHLAATRQELRGVRRLEPDAELDADLLLDDLHTLDGIETEEITPSVRLKPTAKSSRSCGLAIITA
jgi:hypothetical protein